MTIQATVARVISDREVALSAGAEDGVAVDDVATIFDRMEVTDPTTGELLGVVKRPAIRFVIAEVQPRLSVGRTFERVESAADDDVFRLLARSSAPFRRVTDKDWEQDAKTFFVPVGTEVEINEPAD